MQQTFFAPSEASQKKVLGWLENASIDMSSVHLKKAAAVMEFSAQVTQLAHLLGDKVQIMHNDATGDFRIEPSDHEVPSEMKDYVQFITLAPSTKGSKVKRSRPAKPSPAPLPPPYKLPVTDDLRNCSESWTPACIRSKFENDLCKH
jgi:tripeptidyl-peptidase-1